MSPVPFLRRSDAEPPPEREPSIIYPASEPGFIFAGEDDPEGAAACLEAAARDAAEAYERQRWPWGRSG